MGLAGASYAAYGTAERVISSAVGVAASVWDCPPSPISVESVVAKPAMGVVVS